MYIKFYNALGLVDLLAGRGQSPMPLWDTGRQAPPTPPPGPDTINPNLSSRTALGLMHGLGSARFAHSRVLPGIYFLRRD